MYVHKSILWEKSKYFQEACKPENFKVRVCVIEPKESQTRPAPSLISQFQVTNISEFL